METRLICICFFLFANFQKNLFTWEWKTGWWQWDVLFVCVVWVRPCFVCLSWLPALAHTCPAWALLAPPCQRYHLHISSLSDPPPSVCRSLHLHFTLISVWSHLSFSGCPVSAVSCSWVQTLIFHVFKGPVGKNWGHLVVGKYSANKWKPMWSLQLSKNKLHFLKDLINKLSIFIIKI